MPALITHYLFGEEALNRGLLPVVGGSDEAREGLRQAFLLGCQGPDPFFFAFSSPRAPAMHALARSMHRGRMTAAFEELRRGTGRLPAGARPLGEAFACGLLAHYQLDRTAHPYVFALESELCDGEEGERNGLSDARHEVHALIESELDCGMLDELRGVGTADFPPVGALDAPAEAERAGGALMADAALEAFGIALRPADLAGAVADMRFCYRSIEPLGSARQAALSAAERAARSHSMLSALAHRPGLGARGNASMNLGRREWRDPFKEGPDGAGLASCESFPEVFERALGGYAGLAAAFLNGEPLAGQVARLDYGGRRLGADELAQEDGGR